MWAGISQIVTQVLQLTIKVILARLLAPQVFGILGMAMIFVGFVETVNEMGLSAALVQRKEVTEKHRSTIFWVSLMSGAALTGIGLAAAPAIASFFRTESLTGVIRALSAGFFIGSFAIIHTSMLTRKTRFDRIAAVEISAAFTYGLISISLAEAGMGIWSLVLGSLGSTTLKAVLYWLSYPWRPALLFDLRSFRELFSFGKNVMGSRMLNFVDSNTDYLVVGRLLRAEALGLYTMAYQAAIFPMTQISKVISRVTFPVFSILQDDNAKLRQGYTRVIRYSSLLTFPVLAGMILVSPELLPQLLGRRWAGAVMPLQILCIYGMLVSVGTHVGTILLGKGRSDIQFRWNILTVIVYPLAVITGVRFGVNGVAAATTIAGLLLFFIIQTITNRQIEMSYREFFAALAPAAVCCLLMSACVLVFKAIATATLMEQAFLLAGSIAVGVITYPVSIRIGFPGLLSEVFSMAMIMIQRKKGGSHDA